MCEDSPTTGGRDVHVAVRGDIVGTTGVAGVPGEAFFAGAEGHRFIRFCFAKTDTDLDDACRRIEQLG